MKSKTGKYVVVWNKLPQKRLQKIHNYIKYYKLEPLSADKLVDELIEFGECLCLLPTGYPIVKKLSNSRFTYRSVSFKKVYRLIFRINEKKKEVIIVNLFHNNRHPNKLGKR